MQMIAILSMSFQAVFVNILDFYQDLCIFLFCRISLKTKVKIIVINEQNHIFLSFSLFFSNNILANLQKVSFCRQEMRFNQESPENWFPFTLIATNVPGHA